jgi:flagellar motor switch protein FliM
MSSEPDNSDPKPDKMHPGNRSLSRAKIQQLLVAIGSEPAEDTAVTETTDYNWKQLRHFTNAQHKKLGDFAKKVAKAATEKLSALCHNDFNVTINSTAEHFARELTDQAASSEQEDYYLALGATRDQRSEPRPEDNTNITPSKTKNGAVLYPRGFICVPLQTAVTWITQMLGDSESENDSGRELSQFEESLLADTARALVQAFSESHVSYDFQPAETIVRGHLPFELRGSEELYKITFGFEKYDSENPEKIGEAYLLIFCSQLEPVVGKTAQSDTGFSADDISKTMLEHLQQMPISVTAQLGSAVLTFEEIMDLRPCDILLLDKRIDDPIELIAEGRAILGGHPAKSASSYAVVITEDTERTPPDLRTHEAPHNTT